MLIVIRYSHANQKTANKSLLQYEKENLEALFLLFMLELFTSKFLSYIHDF